MASRTRTWHHVNNRRKQVVKHRHRHLITRFFKTWSDHPERLRTTRLLAALGSGSIPLDVSHAVEGQLDQDGIASPHDPEKVMKDDYGYNDDSMDGFLTSVSKRLADDYGHDFQYKTPFIKDALKAKLHDLKQLITDRTT